MGRFNCRCGQKDVHPVNRRPGGCVFCVLSGTNQNLRSDPTFGAGE